jgi:hypothetical protein
MNKLEVIHESLINGQRRQMVDQIDEYGVHDFFPDFLAYINEIHANIGFFTDCVISYHRIKGR